MTVIETKGLSKTYLSHRREPGALGAVKSLFRREKIEVPAVREVSMQIGEGEMVGFLGPNGAGKTTTLKMLCGILYPSQGEATVLGFRPFDRNPEMLRQISLVMGNKMQLWWDLPAWDSFLVLKEMYGVDEAAFRRRVDRLVEALDLADKVNVQVRKLSLGERMKCELVAALLHSPRVVFLDEPTIGLDVVSQKRIRDFLKDIHREDNITVLLTSHYMQDVQELCPRVVVIDHGTKVFDGTLEALSAQFQDTRRIRLTFSSPVDSADVARFGRIVAESEVGVTLEVPRADVASVTAATLNAFPVADVGIEDVDIEDVIRSLFSKNLL